MRMVDLIHKKREGHAHTRDELTYIINGFVRDEIPDYQMSAWMMAVCFQGMTQEEATCLTEVMTHSGGTVDLSDLPGIKVDKHSTGGVGDTTTLVIAPLVAACGGTIAKMSGRGLGHTGGTVDKLEAVPGVCTERSIEDFKAIVRQTGLCVVGQTENLVPADKRMYALRDVTGTVQSVPLIASSIMSKKLAAGCEAIVLDVKCGSGAFLGSPADAIMLSEFMVHIGNLMGRKTVAFITDMNQPLGRAVGNGLEVKEAIDLLAGRVPKDDLLYKVCMLLAVQMLLLSDLAADEAEAQAKLEEALSSGAGLKKLGEMLTALGALDAPYVLAHPESLCKTKRVIPVDLEKSGYIGDIKVVEIGSAAQLLGAGRSTKADSIDPAVGLVIRKRRGDFIAEGEPFAELYVNAEDNLEEVIALLREAVCVSDEHPAPIPVVYDFITE